MLPAMIRAALFLLALLSTAAGAQTQPAGRVLLSVGEVTAERGGQRVPLALNAQVFQGDTIRLGASSNAQIRMTDQSVIALRERTGFRIDEYQFSGADGRSFFSLLSGGMRTVTGAIGRLQSQRGNYAVKTPTSTIGIRGTHYTLVHCNNDCGNPGSASALLASASTSANDAGPLAQAGPGGAPIANGTYGGVTDGRIAATPLEAPQLERDFGHDEFFFVANANAAPQSLIAPPSFLFDRLAGQTRAQGKQGTEGGETLAQGGINAESRPSTVPEGPKPSAFVVTEQRTSTGQSVVVPASAAPTYGLMGAWRSADGSVGGGGAFVSPSMVTISGTGNSQTVTAFNIPIGQETTENPVSAPGAFGAVSGSVVQAQVGSSVEILVGRWVNGSVTEDTGTSNIPGGVHYVYGPLTPPEVIAAKSGSFLFSSTGLATTPTHSAGLSLLGGGLPGSLTIDFTQRTASLPSGFLSFSTQSWNFPSAVVPIKIVPGVGASFNVDQFGGSCSGGGCSGTIKYQVSGIFMGPATSMHLGAVYGLGNNLFQTVQGAKVYFCAAC